mgnify:FL=1
MRVGAVCALGALALLSACTGQPESSKTSAEEPAAAELKAVIFEDVKPLFSKTDAGYEGFGVDVLEQVRMQSGRSEVTYQVASSVTDGIDAVATGKADIACGVAFTWGRASQLSYSLPFGVGGTRLLTSNDTTVNGTPDSLKDKTIGVVRDSASAKVLESVVPEATFKAFDTPAEALSAYNDGDVPILGGGTLWLAANSSPDTTALLPFRPYGRSGIGCVVGQNNGKLLSQTNIAIGQMMQAYMDGDAGTREMVDRWIGPDSSVGLTRAGITSLYGLILSITAEISTSVEPGS